MYIFSIIHLTKGKLALVVWWDKPQTFCLGFESSQRHKKEAFFRVHYSYCSGSTVARWPAEISVIFFLLGHFFLLNRRFDLSPNVDISAIFCRFSTIFLHKISCRCIPTQYIADISRHFPLCIGVTDGTFFHPYVYINGLAHLVSYLQQVETMTSYIMTRRLTELLTTLNCIDCPVTYWTTIITV